MFAEPNVLLASSVAPVLKMILDQVGLGLRFNVTDHELKHGNKGAAGYGGEGWEGVLGRDRPVAHILKTDLFNLIIYLTKLLVTHGGAFFYGYLARDIGMTKAGSEGKR